MPSVTEQQLAAWLLPWNAQATESLVRSSGLGRLRELTQLSAYLAAQPGFEEFRPEAVSTLEQFEREQPDVLFRRLASPVFRGWLSRFGGIEDFTPKNALLREQLLLWNNMRYTLLEPSRYSTTLTVIDGCCQTWDPRLAVRVGGHEAVQIDKDDNRLVVRSMEGSTLLDALVDGPRSVSVREVADGCELRFAPYLPDSQIVVRNDLPLLQLRLLGTDRSDAVALGSLDHSAASYPPFDPAPYQEAASIINDVWPEEYADFRETLQVVVPRSSPPRWRARGMTVSSFAGAVWLFVEGVVDLVEHMVHEQSHVKLRYIEDTCPILAPEQTEQRYVVGWRNDPRPIVGIYEGVYVHLHVLTALSACLEQDVFPTPEARACESRCRAVMAQVEEGLALLTAHGRFTETGKVYLRWVEDTLGPLRAWLA
jgi:HEXXH motif-containing protein